MSRSRVLERAFNEVAGPPWPEPCPECAGPIWLERSMIVLYGRDQLGTCGTCGGPTEPSGRSVQQFTSEGPCMIITTRAPEEERPR